MSGHSAATRLEMGRTVSVSNGHAQFEADRTDEVVTEHRPWGHFHRYVANEPVTVKTITVEAGQRLSLQRHDNRSELWQILDEPLQVVVGERQWLAQSGELIWVRRGCAHRISNPGAEAARVLEIAFGDFTEDDIERIEDDYTRD